MTKNPARILVAEDETLIRMDLVEMLREAGYDVVAEATNGSEAIELAEKLRPDLAILDVKMPVLDGERFDDVSHGASISSSLNEISLAKGGQHQDWR